MSQRRDCVIHNPDEIVRIRRAAELTAQVRDELPKLAAPGMSTLELDQIAGALIARTGGRSAFLGYCGYPGNICISLNEEVVHGIGRADRIMTVDDIVSVDIGVEIDGACGDTGVTFALCAPDKIPTETQHLLDNTRGALLAGLKAAKAGKYIRDISAAIEEVGRKAHLGIVQDYVGHGCGIHLHEPPEVPNFVSRGRGAELLPGMVLAVEPMFTLGTHRVVTDSEDHWTVRTRDGKLSAHFEHMVLITENEPEILTWPKTT